MATADEVEAVRVVAHAILQVSSRLNGVQFLSTPDGGSPPGRVSGAGSPAVPVSELLADAEDFPVVNLEDAAGFLTLLKDVITTAVERERAAGKDAEAAILTQLLLRSQPQLIATVVSLLHAPQLLPHQEDGIALIISHTLQFMHAVVALLVADDDEGPGRAERMPARSPRGSGAYGSHPLTAGSPQAAAASEWMGCVAGRNGEANKDHRSGTPPTGTTAESSVAQLSQTVLDLLHRVGLVLLLSNLLHSEYPVAISISAAELLFALLVRSHQARNTVATSGVIAALQSVLVRSSPAVLSAADQMGPNQPGTADTGLLRAYAAACLRELANTHAAALADIETVDVLLRLLAGDASGDVCALAAETLDVLFQRTGAAAWRSCPRKKELASVCAEVLEREGSHITAAMAHLAQGPLADEQTGSGLESLQAVLKLLETLVVMDSTVASETVATDSTFAEYLLALFVDRTLVSLLDEAEPTGDLGYVPFEAPALSAVLCHTARTLRLLLQHAPYYRYAAFELFSHGPSLLVLLQCVMEPNLIAGAASDERGSVLEQTFKVEIAMVIGIGLAQDPRCRQLLFSQLHAPAAGRSGSAGDAEATDAIEEDGIGEKLRRSLLAHINAAALDYFAGVVIVDVTGVEVNALEAVEWETPDRPLREAIHGTFEAQEERWNRWDDVEYRDHVMARERDRAYLAQSEDARLAVSASVDPVGEEQRRSHREERRVRQMRRNRLTFILLSYAIHCSLRFSGPTAPAVLSPPPDPDRDYQLGDEALPRADPPRRGVQPRRHHSPAALASPSPKPYRHANFVHADQGTRGRRGVRGSPDGEDASTLHQRHQPADGGSHRVGSMGLVHSASRNSHPYDAAGIPVKVGVQPPTRRLPLLGGVRGGGGAASAYRSNFASRAPTPPPAHSEASDDDDGLERQHLTDLMDPAEKALLEKFEGALKLCTAFAHHYTTADEAKAQREHLRQPAVYESVKQGLVRRKTPADANAELQRLAAQFDRSRSNGTPRDIDDTDRDERHSTGEGFDGTDGPRRPGRREWVGTGAASAPDRHKPVAKYVHNLGLVGPNTRSWSVAELRKGDLFYFHIPFLDIGAAAVAHVRSRATHHLHLLRKQFIITPNSAKARRWFLHDMTTNVIPGIVHALSVILEMFQYFGEEEVKFAMLVFHREAQQQRTHEQRGSGEGRATSLELAGDSTAAIHSGNLVETVGQLVFYFKRVKEEEVRGREQRQPPSPTSVGPLTGGAPPQTPPFTSPGNQADGSDRHSPWSGRYAQEDVATMPPYASPSATSLPQHQKMARTAPHSTFLADLDNRIQRLLKTQFTGLESTEQLAVMTSPTRTPFSGHHGGSDAVDDSDYDEIEAVKR